SDPIKVKECSISSSLLAAITRRSLLKSQKEYRDSGFFFMRFDQRQFERRLARRFSNCGNGRS
ncbi:hypothetical protein, partial [Vibrio harveyi]|uniref:hypothetical protein n=1 Tax=Vibrio harveyi TaxID=669 RepID=UPI001C0ED97C